jgi:hypothetical protein
MYLIVSHICFVVLMGPSGEISQNDAVAEIVKAGGRVIRRSKQSDSPIVGVDFLHCKLPKGTLKALRAFPELEVVGLADAAFAEEDMKYLTGISGLKGLDLCADVTDSALKEVAKFKRLQWLELAGSKVTDEGIKELAGLSDLESLGLSSNPRLKGETLGALRGLRKLRELHLARTSVNDAGLQGVGQLVYLETLELGGTKITDVGLSHLSKLTELRSLVLAYRRPDFQTTVGEEISDAGLVHLTSLTKLERLLVSSPKITDRGVARLKSLRELKWLWLDGTDITDRALDDLKGLTKLESLGFRGTKISEEGFRALQKELPKVKAVN